MGYIVNVYNLLCSVMAMYVAYQTVENSITPPQKKHALVVHTQNV